MPLCQDSCRVIWFIDNVAAAKSLPCVLLNSASLPVFYSAAFTMSIKSDDATTILTQGERQNPGNMNTVKDGKICIAEDCVAFTTSPVELVEWTKRNNVYCSESVDHRSYFASIATAEYCGTPMRVVMTIDQSGLQSFSLRRIDWLAIGNSIADYDAKALRAEYRNLGSLVEPAVKRKPDIVSGRELTWTEGIYDVTVSYEPMAFEVGIFFSRRKAKQSN